MIKKLLVVATGAGFATMIGVASVNAWGVQRPAEPVQADDDGAVHRGTRHRSIHRGGHYRMYYGGGRGGRGGGGGFRGGK